MIEPIITKRLRLREIEKQDTAQIVEWRGKPEVYQFFLNPHQLSEEEHLNWFYNRYLRDQTRYDWIAEDLSTGDGVGIYGVKYSESDKTVEISYLTEPAKQGRGYAIEAVESLMYWAKNQWNCSEFLAEIHCANEVSQKFVEKMGFTKVLQDGLFVVYKRVL